jgi:hydroxymethylbilane synthase
VEQRLGSEEVLRIGTRGSDLALWQATTVQGLLSVPNELVIIKTEGDKRLDISLQGGTTTGFFTKDIERRLIDHEIDVAVHQDLLLVHPDWHDPDALLPLRAGCRVGAGSLRRQSLVKHYRPEASPELIRGNVPTRVSKAVDGSYGAVVLARAGVERLKLDVSPLIVYALNLDYWLPAPGQGAVAVQVRKGDERARKACAAINHEPTETAVCLERQLLANFEGGCHTAFGAFAREDRGEWLVDIGMDRGEDGWGTLALAGPAESCRETGPEALPEFVGPAGVRREELCQRIQWSF